MYTNADLMEQAHNSMNLALGKPTQSFHTKGDSHVVPLDIANNQVSDRNTLDPLGHSSRMINDSIFSGA